jgi:cytoskeletal protein CcmA (bactofilin family)
MLKAGRHPKDTQSHSAPTTDQTSQPASPYNANLNFQTPTQPASTSRAVTDSESLAHDISKGLLDGYAGHGAEFSGEMGFKGMLRVDGHLSGRISSQDGTLILSTGGRIDADIEVAVALINGTVNGDIIATKRIEISRVARVTGNIQTPLLTIEEGAIFEGSCRVLTLKEAQDEQGEETGGANVLVMRASHRVVH